MQYYPIRRGSRIGRSLVQRPEQVSVAQQVFLAAQQRTQQTEQPQQPLPAQQISMVHLVGHRTGPIGTYVGPKNRVFRLYISPAEGFEKDGKTN